MQRLTLLMIIVATTFEFFSKGDEWGRWAILPHDAKYLGEILSGAALLYAIVAGTRTRFQFVRPAYWIVFGALLFTIAAGVVLNSVEAGPIFAGLRTYLRALPWFFVGAVFAFTEPQIKKQLQLLLALALIQLPFAIDQRAQTIKSGTSLTGDNTVGTLTGSSTLSIFLISGMCVLVALAARKRLRRLHFAILFPLLLVPTLINETKATVILLPLALIVTYWAASEPGKRIRALVIASVLVVLSVATFIPVYDHFKKEGQPSLIEFYTDTEKVEQYLWTKENVGTSRDKPAGMVDSVLIPLGQLSTDPLHFVFGYGIGNVSDSALGAAYVGRYFDKFHVFMTTAFSQITLELGMLGLILVLILMWMVYRDSLVTARRSSDLMGAIAAALAGITAVIVLSIPYKDLTGQLSLSLLFWYFAGLVAAHRMRISHTAG